MISEDGKHYYSYSIFEYKYKDFSYAAQMLYTYLCCKADENLCVSLSYKTIMNDCYINSQTTVSKTLKQLIAAGLIIKEQRFGEHGIRISNHYKVIDPAHSNYIAYKPLDEEDDEEEE